MRIIISGGGTGGHVFPAIAIADALKKMAPDATILFVGAEGRLEMEKVPAAGYEIKGLKISGLQRKISAGNLSFPFKVLKSLLDARKIIRNFKPDVAVGVGGYASGPLLFAASLMGVPTVIQEQNSFPGLTNKLLAKRAKKICVAYENMDRFFPSGKIILTGNPVRKSMVDIEGKRDDAMQFFGLKNHYKTVLFIGGSLGARTINRSAEKILDILTSSGIQVIWQTGKLYYQQASGAGEKFKEVPVRVHEFITRMDYAYAAADFIVSRAGAIAVSELEIIAKPLILIPSPNVAEDHQTKNALALVNRNAAIMVKDDEAEEKLGPVLMMLMQNTQLQQDISEHLKTISCKDSDEKISEVILELVKKEAAHGERDV